MRGWKTLLALYLLASAAAALGWWGTDWRELHAGAESLSPFVHPPLGTDHLGREVWALVLQGTRLAIAIGAVGAALTLLAGAGAGLLAGSLRGPVDAFLIALAAAFAAIPGILMVLAVGFMLGQGFWTVVTAVAAAGWVGVFRSTRAEVLRLRERGFVAAARLAGAGRLHVLRTHLLRNLRPLLRMQFGLAFVFAIKAEVVVSFLGVGMGGAPSWGRMIADAQSDLQQGLWWPLAAAALAMLGLVSTVQMLCEPRPESSDYTAW